MAEKMSGFRVLYPGRLVSPETHRCVRPITGAQGAVIECKGCGKMYRCTERHHVWSEYDFPPGDGAFSNMVNADNGDGVAIYAMWDEVGPIMSMIYRKMGV